MSKTIPMSRRITPFQLIIMGFVGVILLGSLVLMLIYAALSTTKKRPSKLPQDKITVG